MLPFTVAKRTLGCSVAAASLAFTGSAFADPPYPNPYVFTTSTTIDTAKTGQKMTVDGGGTGATLTVTGESGSLTSTFGVGDAPGGPAFTVGDTGDGNKLVIENGGTVSIKGSGSGNTADTVIGYANGSDGNRIEVTGKGSVLRADSNAAGTGVCAPAECPTLYVGRNGSSNTLSVTEGGQVFTGQMRLGEAAGSGSNTVTVDGPGSELFVRYKLKIGQNGDGNIFTVSGGGQVWVDATPEAGPLSADGYTGLGYNGGSDNNVLRITDVGSLFVTSDLFIGRSGSGNTVKVENGGELRVLDELKLGSGGALKVGNGTGGAIAMINGKTTGGLGSSIEVSGDGKTGSALIFGANSVSSLNTIEELSVDDQSLYAIFADGTNHTQFGANAATIWGTGFVNIGTGTQYADGAFFGSDTVLEQIITCASCVTGNFARVRDNTLAYNFVSVSNGSQIDFQIISTGITTAEDAVRSSGNRAAGGAAKVLDVLLQNVTPAGDDMNSVLVNLDTASSRGELSRFISNTLPLFTGGTTLLTEDSFDVVGNAVWQRLDEAQRSGERTLWLSPLGAGVTQDGDDGATGYESAITGAVGGADMRTSEESLLGLGFAFVRNDADTRSDDVSHSATIDSYSGFAYGEVGFGSGMAVKYRAGAGYNAVDGARRIRFADIDRVAEASYDGWSVHAEAVLEREIALQPQLTVSPSVGLFYLGLWEDGYSETGADSLNLEVDSRDSAALRARLAADLDWAASDVLTVNVGLGAGYDLLDRTPELTAAYAGAPDLSFDVTGLDVSPWSLDTRAALTITPTERLSLSATYAGMVRSGYMSNAGILTAAYSF